MVPHMQIDRGAELICSIRLQATYRSLYPRQPAQELAFRESSCGSAHVD